MQAKEAKQSAHGAWWLLVFAGLLGAALAYGKPTRTSTRQPTSTPRAAETPAEAAPHSDAAGVQASVAQPSSATPGPRAQRTPVTADVDATPEASTPALSRWSAEGAAGGAALEPMDTPRPAPSQARFDAEAVAAPGWRERYITGVFTQAEVGAALLSAECRTTLCRLELDMAQAARATQGMQSVATLLTRSSPSITLSHPKAIVVLDATKLGG